jgi:hypothetical protein
MIKKSGIVEKHRDPDQIEMRKGEFVWILDLIFTHPNYVENQPPLEYMGRFDGDLRLNEEFDIFKSFNGIYLCYSDLDRLVYCSKENTARIQSVHSMSKSDWSFYGPIVGPDQLNE